MVDGVFGEAGARVLVEQRLSGPETSAHAFTDGTAVAHMPFSCDHKPVFDGDRGPNTGGMGVYSPPGWLTEDDARSIERGRDGARRLPPSRHPAASTAACSTPA